MNHPLRDPTIESRPLSTIPPIKPCSALDHLISPLSPDPSTLQSSLNQQVHPSFNLSSTQPPQTHRSRSTLQKLTKAIKKSTSFMNRFVKGNRNQPPTSSSCNNLPISVNLDPPHPHPLLSSPPISSSANLTRYSACQLQSHFPCLDDSSISPRSLANFIPLNPCHSATSSAEFSFRLGSNVDNCSSSSPPSKGRLNWVKKLSHTNPRTYLPWSDQDSTHPTVTSNAGRSCSPAPSSSPGSSGNRKYCNSLSPNHLQPVFGISVKDALQLASQEYQSPHGKVKIPTIVYKCGERLKCDRGVKSHGVFRINGNIKRMRNLESIFMNHDLGYGTDFDISNPKPLTDSHTVEGSTQSGLALDSQSGPCFTLHDVAGVLRRYLWALPEPLVAYSVTIELIQVWRKLHGSMQDGSRETLIEELEKVLKQNMKTEELDLLNYLLEILGLFSIRSEDNLMNSKNLAIVFQPGIMPIPISEEYQSNCQHSHLNQHQHQRLHLHQFPKSRSSDQISHPYQPHAPIDSQQTSSLQIAHGIGLNDYLGQINEVQEILSLLIIQSASLSNDLNDAHCQQRPHSELGSGDDGG